MEVPHILDAMNNFMQKFLFCPYFRWVELVFAYIHWPPEAGQQRKYEQGRQKKLVQDQPGRKCMNLDQPNKQQILYKLDDPHAVNDCNFNTVHSLLNSVQELSCEPLFPAEHTAQVTSQGENSPRLPCRQWPRSPKMYPNSS